jgi:hypothetical protein
MFGLVWNGRDQDRELLSQLERPVWKEVAQELKSKITDQCPQLLLHTKRGARQLLHARRVRLLRSP